MSPAALLTYGLPPFGKGLYARDSIERGNWDFVAVNAWRSDRGAQVADVRAHGATPWLYGTPEHFTPETWREGLAYIVGECVRLGCAGVIVDPENGWHDSDAGEARAFGAACADASADVRVGVTSFPEWPVLASFAATCGMGVFGSPQIYGRTSQSPETFAAWRDRWGHFFGERLLIGIAGWPSSTPLASPEGFAAYLGNLPSAPGYIVWDAAGAMPSYIVEALADFSPVSARARQATALATHPPTIVVLALVALVAFLALKKGA